MNYRFLIVLLPLALSGLMGCPANNITAPSAPNPVVPTSTFTSTFTTVFTSTPSSTPTSTFTPTSTPTNTNTSTPTNTATVTNTYTPSDTPTVTFTPTVTSTPIVVYVVMSAGVSFNGTLPVTYVSGKMSINDTVTCTSMCSYGSGATTFMLGSWTNTDSSGNPYLPTNSNQIYPRSGDHYSLTFNDTVNFVNGITVGIVANGVTINSQTTGGASGYVLTLSGNF